MSYRIEVFFFVWNGAQNNLGTNASNSGMVCVNHKYVCESSWERYSTRRTYLFQGDISAVFTLVFLGVHIPCFSFIGISEDMPDVHSFSSLMLLYDSLISWVLGRQGSFTVLTLNGCDVSERLPIIAVGLGLTFLPCFLFHAHFKDLPFEFVSANSRPSGWLQWIQLGRLFAATMAWISGLPPFTLPFIFSYCSYSLSFSLSLSLSLSVCLYKTYHHAPLSISLFLRNYIYIYIYTERKREREREEENERDENRSL